MARHGHVRGAVARRACVVKHERGTIALMMADSLRSQPLPKGDRIGFREGARMAYDASRPATASISWRTRRRTISLNWADSSRRFARFSGRSTSISSSRRSPGGTSCRAKEASCSRDRRATARRASPAARPTTLAADRPPCRFNRSWARKIIDVAGRHRSQSKERFAAARDAAQDGPW